MIKFFRSSFWLLLLCAASIGHAQDFSNERGYVDFGNLSAGFGEPKVQINLGPAMLNFLGSAAKSQEPEVAALFNNLKTIRVFVYNLTEGSDAALNTVERVSRDIENNGWETVVMVNEEKEKVRIYSKLTNGIMDGLVVMVVESGSEAAGQAAEAVFINIIGSIDPEQLARVTDSLDINVELN